MDDSEKSEIDKNWELVLKLREKRENEEWEQMKDKPPLPPWLKYPDIPEGSIEWRMGACEDYICMVHLYLKRCSTEQRASYESKYPTPLDWGSFYDYIEI